MSGDIELRDAKVYFPVAAGAVRAVDGVDITFSSGEITGIIGESGCGKSVLGMYLLGLLPDYARKSGQIRYGGKDLEQLPERERRRMRGACLGLIPQNPGDSLNPVRKVGSQIQEALRLLPKNRQNTVTPGGLLCRFGFSQEQVLRVERAYSFELSGGMQQRAVAAMGVAAHPQWIIADEPSKGLDMALREQMYETLRCVRSQEVEGMIIITHDLVLAQQLCDQIAVMYAGHILEQGRGVPRKPLHPYTKGLLDSLPARGMHPMRGIAPAPGQRLEGCRFAPRCPFAQQLCREREPAQYEIGERKVRCFLYA